MSGTHRRIALAGVAALLAAAPLIGGAGSASAATSGFVPSVSSGRTPPTATP